VTLPRGGRKECSSGPFSPWRGVCERRVSRPDRSGGLAELEQKEELLRDLGRPGEAVFLQQHSLREKPASRGYNKTQQLENKWLIFTKLFSLTIVYRMI
jgi:hypothetical protein